MRNQVCRRPGHRDHARRQLPRRRGSIIVLTAILMIVLMALLALSIDTGYMYTMQTELDRSVDAAALAGAASLVEGPDYANDKVVEYLVRNPVGGDEGAITDDRLAEFTTRFLADHSDDYSVTIGNWNAASSQLEPAEKYPSALEVTMRYPNLPLFFGRVLGKDHFSIESRAIAMYQPRDIVLVLDYSGSMNDDSELKSFATVGQNAVMDNLQQIYDELGQPIYGNMSFQPEYATVVGVEPVDKSLPHITVEYRGTSVYITSTKDISNVVLQLSDGSLVRDESFGDGTLSTTMSAGQEIVKAWVKSGTNAAYWENTYGYGEEFNFSLNSTFVDALELTDVPYPYPSGSWSDYVNYVRTSSTIANAGFKHQYGYANLINYWLERKPAYSQTPDLWKVSAQPVTAVKDAVDVFMDYMNFVDTDDRLALVVYNGPGGGAKVEIPLTMDINTVATRARERQAGHYHSYTNIGGGMEAARYELLQNARMGAFKMVVLMTDGRANWYNGTYDMAAARNQVLNEAYAAKAENIPVVTISLGAGADVDLMNQVAEITESRTFNVPGGQAVSEYREALFQVFREIADHRPMKLVQ